jgi:hypothetical protein
MRGDSNPTMGQKYLYLRGLRAPVRLSGSDWQAEEIAPFLPNWPFVISASAKSPPFAELDRNLDGITFTSDFSDGPVHHKTLVNSLCDVIAPAARQRTVEVPSDLCLHAAAVNLGTGLVVFPALRRAGKSVLTSAFAARGHQVFSDDVLPVTAVPGQPIQGQATGAAIRLRLPVPDGMPGWLISHLRKCRGPTNRQYQFVPSPAVAENGTLAPLRMVVGLAYEPGAKAAIEPMERDEMLKTLLKQNFGREATADHILFALLALVRSLPLFRLVYSDVGAAVDLITSVADQVGEPQAIFPEPPQPSAAGGGRGQLSADQPMRRHAGAMVVAVDNVAFGTSSDQRRILHLDQGALRFWTLLAQPVSENEAVEILCAAFPDQSETALRADTRKIFDRFWQAGMIEPAGE